MYRKTAFLALLAGGLLTGSAIAADWSSFEGAFPAFPCNDGWSACIVRGEQVTPELREGDGGLMHPAAMRLDWNSLDPTLAFSPFSKLSKYTGELPDAIADAEEEELPVEDDGDDWEPAADDGGGETWSGGGASDDGGGSYSDDGGGASDDGGGSYNDDGGGGGYDDGGGVADASDSMVRPTGGDDSMVRPTGGDDSMVRPTGGDDSMVRPTGGDDSMVRPTGGDDPMVRPTGGDDSMVRPTSGDDASNTSTPDPMVRPESEGQDAVVVHDPGPPAPTGPETCDNLTLLEPAAMMGKLSDGQVGCLEASLAAAGSQTDKDKLSRVLMANAWSKGDKKTWEKLVKRHLDEIDQSDPDICYKYALYLSKKGAGRAHGVIRWADVALENRTRWSGDTYKSRVYNLYKLRSASAQKLWQQAENKHASAPTDQTGADVEKYRNMTKVNSREWFEYAREAGKDTTKALQLCVSAAGTKEYCEGS